MSEIMFWTFITLLFYIYFGYAFVLFLLDLFVVGPEVASFRPGNILVTVIIAAFNEEEVIRKRIENLQKQDYLSGEVEIVVASDGSNDNTVKCAHDMGVKVLDFQERRGRASIHNDGVREARGGVIIFTDANTIFAQDFITKILAPFSNPRVGVAVGRLVYLNEGENVISESLGLYWRYELWLRNLQSKLGVLATGSGACMAVRKSLYKQLHTDEDVDFTTPLDVIAQGYRILYQNTALAFDTMPGTFRSSFNSKVRMTSRNFVGTLRKLKLGFILKYPCIFWAILSHKVLRWLTPFFMLGALFTNFLIYQQSAVYQISLWLQTAFYFSGIIGFLVYLRAGRLSWISMIFTFCSTNLAYFIGLIKGLLGKAPKVYGG